MNTPMEASISYQDSNGDGIPDVFENRQPISEILSSEFNRQPTRQELRDRIALLEAQVQELEDRTALEQHRNEALTAQLSVQDHQWDTSDISVIVEIELNERPPKKGEYFLGSSGAHGRGGIRCAGQDYPSGDNVLVIRRVIAGEQKLK